MTQAPFIPETAPFTPEQRAWLNGFLAGLFAHESLGRNGVPQPAGSVAKPSEPLLILFGSQTGTAEGLARRCATEASNRGFALRVFALNDYEQAAFAMAANALIISSTWGEGDPPDNATGFWSWLNSSAAPRLEHLHYAVLGLGDRNYADFCGASKKFDTRLEALGAQRIIPHGECDTDYEAAAATWFENLWSALPKNAESAPAFLNGNETRNPGYAPAQTRNYNKSNPFPARLLRNVLLNKPGSAKEVRHYELSLTESGLAYQAGDALGIAPTNCPELVSDFLIALHLSGNEPAAVAQATVPLREALMRNYDITKPSRELLTEIGARAPGSELSTLLRPDRAADLKQWLWGKDVLDVLSLLEKPLAPQELLPLLRPLSCRLYSIASSPKAHPEEVHLTVSAVRYESCGRRRKGVASTCLADRVGDTDCAKVFVQPSNGFKLPLNPGTPVIMVGPGTGIAPFRAFLEEREVTGAKGRNWLFFGDQKRSSDFLYEDQLCTWLKSGHLARLDLAFSRDQTDKVYVQDRMRENTTELWSWLEEGAHFYVCGDASRMAKDVDATLHHIIQTAGGKSDDEAEVYVQKLKSAKRYQRDVY